MVREENSLEVTAGHHSLSLWEKQTTFGGHRVRGIAWRVERLSHSS